MPSHDEPLVSESQLSQRIKGKGLVYNFLDAPFISSQVDQQPNILGPISVVNKLPRTKAEIFFRANDYENLRLAIEAGSTEHIRKACAVLGNTEILNCLDRTDVLDSFVKAATQGHVETIKLLLDSVRANDTWLDKLWAKLKPKSIVLKAEKWVESTLYSTDCTSKIAQAGQLEVVKSIFEIVRPRVRRSLIEAKGKDYSVLYQAIDSGNVELVSFLIQTLEVGDADFKKQDPGHPERKTWIYAALFGGRKGNEDTSGVSKYRSFKAALAHPDTTVSNQMLKLLWSCSGEQMRSELGKHFVASWIQSELRASTSHNGPPRVRTTLEAFRQLFSCSSYFGSESLTVKTLMERSGALSRLVAAKRLDLLQVVAEKLDNAEWGQVLNKLPKDFVEGYARIFHTGCTVKEQIVNHSEMHINYNSGESRWRAMTGGSAPEGLSAESPFGFKSQKTQASYSLLCKLLEPHKSVIADYKRTAYSLAVIFKNKERALQYWNKHVEPLVKDEDTLLLREALDIRIPRYGTWTQSIWAERLMKFGPTGAQYLPRAKELEQLEQEAPIFEGTSLKNIHPERLEGLFAASYYSGVTSSSLEWAKLALKYGLKQEVFDRGVEILSNVKAEHRLPAVYVDGADFPDPWRNENYELVQLAPDDPRNLIVGLLVNCCNHIDEGQTADIAEDHVVDPNAACYILQKKARGDKSPVVIAKVSAAYTQEANILFNSWQRLGPEYDTDKFRASFLVALGRGLLIADSEVERVLMGVTGENDTGFDQSGAIETADVDSIFADALNQQVEIITRDQL